MSNTQPITRLLLDWRDGDATALEQLTPLVYGELHRLAARYLGREKPGHTLQPTALVHEAYLRLVEQDHQTWESRTQFFGVAAHLMRLILVDWARKSRADKRGSGVKPVPLEDLVLPETEKPERLIALDDALTDLSAVDPRKVEVIERRYFGGMTVEEVARSMGISTATVERETRMAQLWLCRQLEGESQA